MRVLFVSHSAMSGGANVVARELLDRAPHDVEARWVFLEPGPDARRSPVSWATVPAGRAREVWRFPGVVRALRAAIRGAGADLVFAHVSKAQVYAAPAAALEGVPCVWWQHERVGQKRLMHEVAGRLPAHAVICSADHTAEEQRRRWPATPVHRVYPGVAAERVPVPRAHRETESPVIGIVGRLQRWKRVERAILALAEARSEMPSLTLRVIGGGFEGLDDGYEAELRALADSLGLRDSIEFSGEVLDGLGAIGDLDVLIHCAEQEPFGLVPVEAMLWGVPPLVADEGGPRESVRHGIDGLRVDARDQVAMARAIVRLCGDSRLRARMGASGRSRVLERFTAERMASEAWTIVRSVAGSEDDPAVA